jgi:hypothetical protein
LAGFYTVTLFIVLTVAILLWAIGRGYLSASPRMLARQGRQFAGVGALAVAALLAVRGRFDIGLVLGGVGAWLLGHNSLKEAVDRWTGFGGGAGTSRIRTALLAVEVDLRSGAISGEVLAGPLTGRRIEQLAREELVALVRSAQRADPLAAGLLEAHLDRRFAGWREDFKFDADAGQAAPAQPSVMTPQEAYEILGLQPGASAESIRAAYRSLMKKLHPDHGGTTYLAARINEAKDVLLSRHR